MSAPPEDMSSPPQNAQPEHTGTVRHIPIFVEGRDEPVINKTERKQTPPPPKPQPQPHVDRDHYFADEGPPSFHHPPNFARAFGTPFNKGFRQGPQPFTQQKAYPQNAFRGGSPARAQSPARASPQEQTPRAPPQSAPPQSAPPQSAPPQSAPPQPEPPRQTSPPPPPPKPSPNDPITQILAIQTDVLNLMSEVENFTGTKKDKRYIFLDEMLTRNLIKLDNIETEGKENIRLARKEAIRCIQKCIAVLEAKAEKGSAAAQDLAMKDNTEAPADNGAVEMKEEKTEPLAEMQIEQNGELAKEHASEPKTTEPEVAQPALEQATPSENAEEQNVEANPSPKKKVVKKRDKSKDKAPEAAKDSNKVDECVEVMQVDNKGVSEQVMDVDGAASQ